MVIGCLGVPCLCSFFDYIGVLFGWLLSPRTLWFWVLVLDFVIVYWHILVCFEFMVGFVWCDYLTLGCVVLLIGGVLLLD